MTQTLPKMLCFVDSENEGSSAIDSVLGFSNEDIEVYYFYSKNSIKQAEKDADKFFNQKIPFHAIPCDTGPSAMDYQLIGYMGYIIGQHPNEEYLVLSNDHHFDAPIKRFLELGVNVRKVGVNQVTKETEEKFINESCDITNTEHRIKEAELKPPVPEKSGKIWQNKKEKSRKFLEVCGLTGYNVELLTDIAEHSKGVMSEFCGLIQANFPHSQSSKLLYYSTNTRKAFLAEFKKDGSISEEGVEALKKAWEKDLAKKEKKGKKNG